MMRQGLCQRGETLPNALAPMASALQDCPRGRTGKARREAGDPRQGTRSSRWCLACNASWGGFK